MPLTDYLREQFYQRFPVLARKILDIDYNQSNKLYFTCEWPEPFQRLYHDLEIDFYYCKHPHVIPWIKKEMVRVLSARIEHFILEEGVQDVAIKS